VEEFTLGILANLEDHGVQSLTDLADGAELLRKIDALIEVIRIRKDLLRFLEADPAPGIAPKALALPLIEVESHEV
jgi:hypothetical protein